VRIIAILVFAAGALAGQTPAALTLTSPAFANNAAIPWPYTGYGEFKSPPLAWAGAPTATRAFALIVENRDVPVERFSLHWLLYNIPATVTRLPEAARPADVNAPRPAPIKGAAQGSNWMKRVGWLPPRPLPKSGPQRYTFTLYALDADLKLAEGLTKEQLLAAMKGHVLAEAALVGVVEPKEP
jgi:Raf kinase inhibitor-like YbhB/YbcL family protein